MPESNNGNSGITWQQFVVIILPLFVSLLVTTYVLIMQTKTEVRLEILDNRDSIRKMQKDVALMEAQVLSIKTMLKEKE